MLSPFDEFPIHQTSRTFAELPSTDFSWDDGCYFGIFSADERVFLACGYRVNANTDMIGGFAILNVAGQQRTVRFSRCWRQEMDTRIGPFRVEVIEPLRRLRLTLEPNDSGISFAIDWHGVSPAVLEDHHDASNRMRKTTDQSRYCQPGAPQGFIALGERHWTVDPTSWHAARDHSWGLYAERRPLSPDPKWLPPKSPKGAQRALRFWIIFRSEPYSGFYHLHEDSKGVRRQFDDVFGTPLGGSIAEGWNGVSHEIVDARHEAEYLPGTKVLKRVTMTLTDALGGVWSQEFETAGPPWMGQTSGYYPGGWKDGGNVHTYHGSEELALEWDEFDFSSQPLVHEGYKTDDGHFDGFGRGEVKGHPVQGNVYLCSVQTTAPDGSISIGAAHVEHYYNGPYHPYGIA
ncbi:hypothetical protein [Novosphingobium aquimarinum]|uniref:hypothetical protein n=1 Tax=Novosphingobium aquimarinum TaxID=2682494 RepID=UPI0012EBB155|nr:hypothetical protein [Novosphingobium aquimarinum]